MSQKTMRKSSKMLALAVAMLAVIVVVLVGLGRMAFSRADIGTVSDDASGRTMFACHAAPFSAQTAVTTTSESSIDRTGDRIGSSSDSSNPLTRRITTSAPTT